MNLVSVISHQGGWDKIKDSNEVEELVAGFSAFMKLRDADKKRNSSAIWSELIEDKGWIKDERSKLVGHAKSHTYGRVLDGTYEFIYEFIYDWVFSFTKYLYNYDSHRVPVLLVQMGENNINRVMQWGTFEVIYKHIKRLCPLSLKHPFVIIGLNDRGFDFGDPCVFELETGSYSPTPNTDIFVINDRQVFIPNELFEPMLLVAGGFGRFLKTRHSTSETRFNFEIEEKTFKLTLSTTLNQYSDVQNSINDFISFFDGHNSVLNKVSEEYVRLLEQKTIVEALLVNANRRLDFEEEKNATYTRFSNILVDTFCADEKLRVLEKREVDVLIAALYDLIQCFDEKTDEDFKFNIQSFTKNLEKELSERGDLDKVESLKRSLFIFVETTFALMKTGNKVLSDAGKVVANIEKVRSILSRRPGEFREEDEQ